MDQGAWDHTASLICTTAEQNRDRKKHPKPFTPNDFNPYLIDLPAAKPARIPASIHALKFFLPNRKRNRKRKAKR